MDNQNNQNNQNQQNGYTNFNNYQQPVNGQNAQPPVPPQAGQPVPPQQGQQLPYQTYQAQPVVQQKDNSTTMGVLAIVLGLVSLIFCPYILGAAGIGCAISGMNKNKSSVICKVGLVISIVALVINIIWKIYSSVLHPEIQQQTVDNLENMLGLSTMLFR